MTCPKCGFPLPADSEFCQYCGVKLGEPQPSFASEEGVVAPVENSEPLPAATLEPVVMEAADVEPPLDAVYQAEAIPFVPETKPHPSEKASKKQVYCKKCGSPIDRATKKCAGCGKQYFHTKALVPFILSVLLLGLVGLNIFQHTLNQEYVKEIEQFEDTLSKKEAIISGLRTTISSQKSTISDLEENVERLERAHADALFDLFFYETAAGVVPNDGTRMYHTYRCENWNRSSSLWIFNIEAAEQRGYYPCPNCH